MATINRKNTSTTPVNRDGLAITLTSSNDDKYPVVYNDDVWGIVATGTSIGKVVSASTQQASYAGTYTEGDIIEAVANKIIDIEDNIHDIIGSGGTVQQQIKAEIGKLNANKTSENNGVTVSLTQASGVVTNVSVSSTLIGSASDTTDKNTINAAKNLAKEALSKYDSIGSITNAEINSLFN